MSPLEEPRRQLSDSPVETVVSSRYIVATHPSSLSSDTVYGSENEWCKADVTTYAHGYLVTIQIRARHLVAVSVGWPFATLVGGDGTRGGLYPNRHLFRSERSGFD